MKVINFDMDGTIADLYAVENWLPKLRSYDPSPYKDAVPLVRLSYLARLLNLLQSDGWEINIISWLSKEPEPTYDAMVTYAKLTWLKKHMPSVKWDHIYIVAHGTPKQSLSSGILFDDELKNRTAWNQEREDNHAFDETVIFEVLKKLAAGEL